MRLQSKAKVAKMTSQLEEAKKGITDSMMKVTLPNTDKTKICSNQIREKHVISHSDNQTA